MRLETRLDVLINNAGILPRPFSLSPDGISEIMATNHIGTFAFTTSLLPVLKATAETPGSDVRIVTLSGEIARHIVPADIKFESIDDLNVTLGAEGIVSSHRRYALSKLANILFTTELQRRLRTENFPVIAVSLHPGIVSTEGTATTMKTFHWLILNITAIIFYFITIPPSTGSLTSLFAATSPDLRGVNEEKYRGAYLMPYGKITPVRIKGRYEAELAGELWALSEEIVATRMDQAK